MIDALFCDMQEPPRAPQEEQKTRPWLFAVGLVGQLGFMIAVPIAVFALGGSLLDKNYQTSPVFLLGGVFLSGIISTVWVVQRARVLRDQYMKLVDPAATGQKRV
ncbi:AtpZ/AtpI family protein [Patescibacteria group bacterium]|nr:MAG: AtpZ/AtpI family protein [Patescibacteria group bacterium]